MATRKARKKGRKRKVWLKVASVRPHISVTGNKVTLRITLPDPVRRNLYKQLKKIEEKG
jgi:hypothetical protein